jgi:hypothetical protein
VPRQTGCLKGYAASCIYIRSLRTLASQKDIVSRVKEAREFIEGIEPNILMLPDFGHQAKLTRVRRSATLSGLRASLESIIRQKPLNLFQMFDDIE